MTSNDPAKPTPDEKADHGARSEVTWGTGAGRQPYENQELDEGHGPATAGEVSEGDRGELSGRNLEQLDQVKRKP
jgi:hypothetical protein